MFADRTLAYLGSLLLLAGSAVFVLLALTQNNEGHSLGAESVISLVAAVVALLLVKARAFKALWIPGLITIAIFLRCIALFVTDGLNIKGSEVGNSVIADIVTQKVGSSFVRMLETHFSWPLMLAGAILIIWVAHGSEGALFKRTPRTDGQPISFIPEEDNRILHEIIEAPKWPLIYGTFLILTGIIILIAGDPESISQKLIGALVTELGFAFFIAFVIGVTVEIRSHLERDKQISRGILAYVYGANLDNDLFKAAEEYLFRAPFYRTELTVHYEFIARKNGKLTLSYTISYRVHNVSTDKFKYPVHTFVEKSSAQGENREDNDYGLQSILVDGKPVSDAEIKGARDSAEDSDDFFQSRYTIDLNPGESKTVSCVHKIEKFDRDSEMWRSTHPCSGINLIVTWPEEYQLDLKGVAIHPADRDQHPNSGFDSLSEDGRSLRATIERPLFPFNGALFWWEPKPITNGSVGTNAGDGEGSDIQPTQDKAAG